MKKILYDYQVFASQEYGGISRYFYELARRISNTEGFSSTVIAPLHFNSYLQEGGVMVNGIHIPRWPSTDSLVRAIDGVMSPVIGSLYKPAVVHETYYSAYRTILGSVPRVVTVYDMIHEKFSQLLNKSELISERKRQAVKRADHVICISEHTRRDLIEHFNVPEGKTSTIHLGFSLTEGDDQEGELTQLDKPFLLFVGVRAAHKNFNAVLEAFSTSAFLRGSFNLVAFGGGGFSESEIGRIHELGLDSKTVMHIEGGDQVLKKLYSSAVLLVYPSLYEGFGIPPLEAMNFECPVACSLSSSIPEVVGDAAEFFDPRSNDSIRRALERICESTELRNRLRILGKERLKMFSWDKCAEKTANVYRDLTSR